MTTSTKEITNKILELMKAASSLGEIKVWFKGEPPQNRYPSTSWGWVEWMGGPENPSTLSTRADISDLFYVVVVRKHPDQTVAEDAAEDLCDAIEAVVKADATLGAKVLTSHVTNREKEKAFQGDASIIAVKVTIQTMRRG